MISTPPHLPGRIFIQYLVQNILFDYTYMKRNYNFCKGLDVYDGGVSEYYIKFRNTWYRYLKLTMIRHRISLKKLQAFFLWYEEWDDYCCFKYTRRKRNASPVTKDAAAYFQEHQSFNKKVIEQFANYAEITPIFRKNVLKHYRALAYTAKKEPEMVAMVKKQEFRRERDVNDFKKMNFR